MSEQQRQAMVNLHEKTSRRDLKKQSNYSMNKNDPILRKVTQLQKLQTKLRNKKSFKD